MKKMPVSQNEYKVLKDENRLLREQNALLLAKLYGAKTERIEVESQEVQDCLFEEEVIDCPEVDPSEDIDIPAHKRKKSGRKAISDDLPRRVVELDVDEKDRVCGCCGSQRPELPPKTNEVVDFTPAKLDVIRYERKTYGECPSCCGSEGAANGVITAKAVEQLIPKSISTPSLLAFIMTAKYADGLPFYRVAKIVERQGVSLSRATMCNWLQKIGEKAKPLWDGLLEDAKSRDYLQMDETPFQVMKEPGKKNTSKSYMWVIHSPPGRDGPPGSKINVFYYDPSRASHVPKSLIEGFQGRFHSDGYSSYAFLEKQEGVKLLGCWTHARRKFFEADKAYKAIKIKGKKKPNLAGQFLKMIKALYKVDSEAKDRKLCHKARFQLRQDKSLPIIKKIKALLEKTILHAQSSTLLGKALVYLKNQWKYLYRIMDHGEAELSTNWVENAIRPFVIGRKGWLFSGSPKGAQSSAILYSLIETAKSNKWNPQKYLEVLFEKLPHAQSREDIKALLPYNLQRC